MYISIPNKIFPELLTISYTSVDLALDIIGLFASFNSGAMPGITQQLSF